MKLAALFIAFLLGPTALAANSLDDVFNVKEIQDGTAIVEGEIKDLKIGDNLYFVRSPYEFPVQAIAGNKVTVTLKPGSDLQPGNSLMRNPTPQIKKFIEQEKRLKQVLEE